MRAAHLPTPPPTHLYSAGYQGRKRAQVRKRPRDAGCTPMYILYMEECGSKKALSFMQSWPMKLSSSTLTLRFRFTENDFKSPCSWGCGSWSASTPRVRLWLETDGMVLGWRREQWTSHSFYLIWAGPKGSASLCKSGGGSDWPSRIKTPSHVDRPPALL